MWKKLADKYRNDALYRAAIDALVDYGDKMASTIKATASAERKDQDSFWVRLAKKYRNGALYRAALDARAEQGHNDACAVRAILERFAPR